MQTRARQKRLRHITHSPSLHRLVLLCVGWLSQDWVTPGSARTSCTKAILAWYPVGSCWLVVTGLGDTIECQHVRICLAPRLFLHGLLLLHVGLSSRDWLTLWSMPAWAQNLSCTQTILALPPTGFLSQDWVTPWHASIGPEPALHPDYPRTAAGVCWLINRIIDQLVHHWPCACA